MCMRIQNAASPPVVAESYELGRTTDQFNATRECSYAPDSSSTLSATIVTHYQ